MTDAMIARACWDARALIARDGWITGGDGWHGNGGWCIEGALAKVLKCRWSDGGNISYFVNSHPVGQALRKHLGLGGHRPLNDWNDRSATPTLVLAVLGEVAAAHTPKREPVVVPPMPEATVDDGFWARLWQALTASGTEPVPESPVPAPEPSEAPETAPEEIKELVSV
jgi:hypothetical protein